MYMHEKRDFVFTAIDRPKSVPQLLCNQKCISILISNFFINQRSFEYVSNVRVFRFIFDHFLNMSISVKSWF